MSLSVMQAREYLQTQIKKFVVNEGFSAMCNGLIIDEQFNLAPASISHHVDHHKLSGGLIIHTAEVLKHSLAMGHSINADISVLVVAAIFHDCMKVRDYFKNEEDKWDKTKYCKQINHVAGSHAEFIAMCVRHGLFGPHVDHIAHCILAHHGRKEWGSPVEPQTKEAMILHFADMLSCNYGGGE